MIDFLIRRPIAVFATTFSLAAISLLVSWQIPLTVLPPFDIPRLVVEVDRPSQNAYELEEQVLKPLRAELLNLPELADIESFSLDGKGSIRLQYKWGTNMKYAYLQLNERIDQSIHLLPNELERPRVLRLDVSDIPFLQLSMSDSMQTPFELHDFAQNILKRRFEQVAGIAKCEVVGGEVQEVSLKPYLDRLAELNLSVKDLIQQVKDADYQLGSVRFKDGPYEYNLEINAAFYTPKDLQQLQILIGKDRLIPLSDLADIQYTARPSSSFVLRNGRAVILLNLYKQQDANMLQVAEAARTSLKELQAAHPSIDLAIAGDQSGFIRLSLSSLQQSLIYGACFAVLLLFAFLASLRAPFIMLCSVPLSLLISFLGFYALDLSFNLLTLAGLAIGVGVLIDNGIIVVENIERIRQQNPYLEQAIVQAIREISLPLLASTLTTLSIFAPLVFAGELLGHFFREQALAISLALGASLFVAMLFLPALYRAIHRHQAANSLKEWPWQLWVQSRYHHLLEVLLRHKAVSSVVALLVLLILGSSWYRVKREVFPSYTSLSQSLEISWPTQSSMQENQRLSTALSDFLVSQPEVEAVLVLGGAIQQQTNARPQGLHQALCYIDLTHEAEREKLNQQLAHWFNQYQIHAQWQLQNAPNVFSQLLPQQNNALEIHIQDLQNNRPIQARHLEELKLWLSKRAEVKKVQLPYGKYNKGFALLLDQMALARYQIDRQEIIEALQSSLGRRQISQIQAFDRQIAIVLTSAQQQVKPEALLASTLVGEQQVALQHFVRLDTLSRYQMLYAGKTGLEQLLQIEIEQEYTADLITDLAAMLRDWGLNLTINNQQQVATQMAQRIGLLLVIASLLLYLIMSAQFESLRQPLIIILSLPFGWAGSLALLTLTGHSLNLMSGIGIVIVSGIVVNDSILKVDAANRLRKEYKREAAILQAGLIRFRPIVLTTLTTILAVLPIAFTEGLGRIIQLPLSIAIIGGLSMGTLASLFVIPLLYVGLADDE